MCMYLLHVLLDRNARLDTYLLKVPMKTFSSMFYRFKQQMIVNCMPNYQNFKNTEHNKREPNHRVDLVLK